MKTRTLIPILSLLLFSYPSLSQISATGTSSQDFSTINVRADFRGLPVFLDGDSIGKTPLRNHKISVGNHKLIVQPPDWPVWDYRAFNVAFWAAAGDSLSFKATFPQNVFVNSIPYDANVYLNGQIMGKTPLMLSLTRSGNDVIRIEKEGYMTFETKPDSSTKILSVELKEHAAWREKQSAEKNAKEKSIRNNRKLLFSSLGVAVTTGLLTLHFRSRGNDEYSLYEQAANPSVMNEHFDRAQYYDDLASVSYTVFEISFVLSGYFFLISRE
jgi:hypothetical protein